MLCWFQLLMFVTKPSCFEYFWQVKEFGYLFLLCNLPAAKIVLMGSLVWKGIISLIPFFTIFPWICSLVIMQKSKQVSYTVYYKLNSSYFCVTFKFHLFFIILLHIYSKYLYDMWSLTLTVSDLLQLGYYHALLYWKAT